MLAFLVQERKKLLQSRGKNPASMPTVQHDEIQDIAQLRQKLRPAKASPLTVRKEIDEGRPRQVPPPKTRAKPTLLPPPNDFIDDEEDEGDETRF